MTRRAVILAGGLGTRMRRPEAGVALTGEQARAAATGIKCLVPIAGRPFIDHTVEALGRAGIDRIVVVVGPDHRALVDHCERLAATGWNVTTAVQPTPRGTADALLAAEEAVGGEPFLMLNSDNYYPAADLGRLAALDGPGLLAVERQRSLAAGLADEKLRAWAVVERDGKDRLVRLIEKPDAGTWKRLAQPVLLSVNAWRFRPGIFAACRAVAPSPRGELELPAAVTELLAWRPGPPFRVVIATGAVLDLTERSDIPRLESLWRQGPPG